MFYLFVRADVGIGPYAAVIGGTAVGGGVPDAPNTISKTIPRALHFPTKCVILFPYNRAVLKTAPLRGRGSVNQ